jgi:hypothetical protein
MVQKSKMITFAGEDDHLTRGENLVILIIFETLNMFRGSPPLKKLSADLRPAPPFDPGTPARARGSGHQEVENAGH